MGNTMNKIVTYSLLFTMALVMLLGLATLDTPQVIAQDRSGTNMTEEQGEETPEAKAVSELMLAQQLAAYGRENDSATALISAAEIVLNTPTQEASFDKTSEIDESSSSATEITNTNTNDEPPVISASKLLAEAKEIADNDQDLLSIIDDLESQGRPRGRIQGPAVDVETVSPFSSVYYTIRFRGSRRAVVGVRGDGDTDLDCYIYDSNNNLIVSDTDYTDSCLVRWVPAWTGPFRVRVRNRGGVYNTYRMATN
jgi:hypothetical protein